MGEGDPDAEARTDAESAPAPSDGASADGRSTDGGGRPTSWHRGHLTRRRVTGLAGVTVVLGLGAWLTRPAPVQESPGWREGTPLPEARGEMKAAALDGRIFVPGGLVGSGDSTARVDVYDPGADEWTTAASMPTGLNHHGTAAIGDRLYVVGGNEGFTDPPGTAAFAYDPDADAWAELPPMPDGRWGHEAVAVDGRLYVVGGVPDADDRLDTFVYDPGESSWERVAPIPTPREHVAAAALDGEVVVASGRWNDDLTDAVESYDPAANEWRALAPIPTARSGFGAAVLDGGLHAVGGEDPSTVGGWTTDAHERYDPDADAWEERADAPLSIHGNAVVATGGVLYVFGGAWRQGLQSVSAWNDRTFVYEPGGPLMEDT